MKGILISLVMLYAIYGQDNIIKNEVTVIGQTSDIQVLFDNASGARKTYVFKKAVSLASNTTQDTNITVKFSGVGKFITNGFNYTANGNIYCTGQNWDFTNSTDTLTVNGYFNAGNIDVFNGDGVFIYKGRKTPVWWLGMPDGVKAYNTVTNMCVNTGNVEVYFPPSSNPYLMDGEITIDVSDVLFEGYGATIKMSASSGAAKCIRIAGGQNPTDPPVTNVVLRGLIIDCDSTGGRIPNEGATGVFIGNTQKILVKDMIIKDAPGSAVAAGRSAAGDPLPDDVTIDNVYCNKTTLNGISLLGGNKMTIRNCKIDSARGGTLSTGIDLEPNNAAVNTNIIIENNEILDCDEFGVYLPRDNQNITIRGNYIHNNAASGIYVKDDVGEVLIEGNIIQFNAQQGINTELKFTRIFNNHVEGHPSAEILIAVNADSSIVANNLVIDGGGDGIQVDAKHVSVIGNMVSNCLQNGIYTTATTKHCQILNNSLYGGANGNTSYSLLLIQGDSNSVMSNSGYSSRGSLGNEGFIFAGTDARAMFNSCVNTKAPDGFEMVNIDTPYVQIAVNNYDGTSKDLAAYKVSERVTTGRSLAQHTASVLDANISAYADTLQDGVYPGQMKFIMREGASFNLDVWVLTHETSDPEQFTLDASGEYIYLIWTGFQWATIKTTATIP